MTGQNIVLVDFMVCCSFVSVLEAFFSPINIYYAGDIDKTVHLGEARTIGDLYDEVHDHDIAISTYPRLTLALDGRVNRPRVGRVAATAHSHASGEMVPIDRRQLFLTLIGETDLTFKQAERSLEYCLHCWDFTGDVSTVLSYPEFDTPAMRRAVETLQTTDSSYRKLTDTQLPEEATVAALGVETLSPLDRTLLPSTYDSVDLFTESRCSIPPLDVFPTARAVVDAVVDNLSQESASNVAVVLDRSTAFGPLLEAALDVEGIPYHHSEAFVDDDGVRSFLRLLQCAFVGSGLKVRDVQPSLERFGFTVDSTDREQRVATVTGPVYDELNAFFEKAQSSTLSKVVCAFESWTGWSSPPLHDELAVLEIADVPLTDQLVSQLRFYLSSFDVPVEEESTDGVLIADCSSTTYVDRPTVFYLGLGSGWARTPPDVPWIDPESFARRDLDRFQLLLQNGVERHYLVQESRAGEPILPCVYFGELAGRSIESFTDLPHKRYGTTNRVDDPLHSPFEAPEPTPTSISAVSQSTLKRLVNCPREEYFYRLLNSPETYPLARGTAIHEAAELYVTDPSTFDHRRDEIVDAICDQLEPFTSSSRIPVERTRIELTLDILEAYLEANPPQHHEPTGYTYRDRDNAIAARLDVDIESPLVEQWFESPSIGLRGFVDLIRSETELVDYKTGASTKASRLREKAAIDPPHESPNFQAPAYLAQHRRVAPEREISIHFVHVMDAIDEAIAGEDVDPMDLVTTITYLPCTFGEFAARREVYESVTDYADSNDRVKTLVPLGYENYRDFFETHELPRSGEDPEQRELVTQQFVDYTIEHVKDTKYVRNGCRAAIDDIDGLLGSYYLKPDLDAFEAFVHEQIKILEQYHEEGFPVRTREEGPNWSDVHNQDLVIDDE